MTALSLLAGILLGAGAVALFVRGRASLAQREQTVDALVAPLRDSLARVDAKLHDLERDRAHARGALDEQLRTLAAGQERLRGETGALVAALRQPHTRGRWGELQLRRVVELAGMTAHCDFVEQPSVATGDGLLRPDLVVQLPGGKQVIVDAKAPLHAFLDAYEARDESARTAALATHARLLREHVRRLSAKAYWDQFDTVPDFVFLFLPGEHFHSAALEADPSLLEEGARQSVLIATPTTLIALLRAVAYGWQQERVAEDARAVAQLGRELHRRLETFADHLQRVGTRLRSAVGAYNDAVGSFEHRVLPGARRLAEHGVVSAERELAALERVDLTARDLAGSVQEPGPRGTPIS
ncbi:MAG TPA: DNA recombination protein RmuC [Conexibacter sp.]|nr:DNA recombination protein RmuC [Conexibacter sp.]